MGYPLREETAGAYYHVGTRGNNERDIFAGVWSRVLFLVMVQRLAKRYGWRIVAYCLMNNHYHLVLQLLRAGGLWRGMQGLNGGYAIAFNARVGRRDHLFGRRFWSRELEDADDVLTTCAYVHLNPLRSFGIEPDEWEWSGHRAALGIAKPVGFHRVGDLWTLLDERPRDAMDAYARLTATGP